MLFYNKSKVYIFVELDLNIGSAGLRSTGSAFDTFSICPRAQYIYITKSVLVSDLQNFFIFLNTLFVLQKNQWDLHSSLELGRRCKGYLMSTIETVVLYK